MIFLFSFRVGIDLNVLSIPHVFTCCREFQERQQGGAHPCGYWNYCVLRRPSGYDAIHDGPEKRVSSSVMEITASFATLLSNNFTLASNSSSSRCRIVCRRQELTTGPYLQPDEHCHCISSRQTPPAREADRQFQA